MNYAEALASATQLARVLQTSTVVRYWKHSKDFSAATLSAAVQVGGWDQSFIVASVDHKGNVTEGAQAIEVAA